MYYTYVLESDKDDRFYTGFTKDLKLRFEQHDKGLVESTRDRRPLGLVYYEACCHQENAIKRVLQDISWRDVFTKETQILFNRVNMVRAGVAEHPSQWPFSGYNEIQEPRRKCKLIAYDQLRHLFGFETQDHLRAAHRSWVHEALKDGNRVRDAKWSESLASCPVKCPILFNWGGDGRIC